MYFQSKRKNREKRMTGDPSNMDVGPKKMKMEKAEDNPPGYEGKEHVKYRDPGYTRETVKLPEEEPRMKSRVSKEEMHEMEDNYHMDVPDQTDYTLPKKIKRAFMKMDQEPHEVPKPLHGNLVTKTSEKGYQDTMGEERYGPEEEQEDYGAPRSKSRRKKIAIAVIRRKMGKKK